MDLLLEDYPNYKATSWFLVSTYMCKVILKFGRFKKTQPHN